MSRIWGTHHFKFYANDDKTNVMPISIDCLVNALRSAKTIEDFNGWLDKSLDGLVNLHPSDYTTKINNNLEVFTKVWVGNWPNIGFCS